MHAQLTDKKLVCRDFIEALERCHGAGWSKFFGGCNDAKQELNRCLRQERIDRTTKNREQSKVIQEKRRKAREELYRDD